MVPSVWSRLLVRVMAVATPVLGGIAVLPLAPLAASPAPAGASVPADASKYVAVSPDRLADTRGPFGFTRIDDNTIRVRVAGRAGVPDNASAVVLTLTTDNAVGPGFITAFPAGAPLPPTSTLNVDRPGRVIANLATVRLGVDGSVDLFAQVTMDLIVDVAGAYVPVSEPVSAGRLVTFPGGARRALDTRDAASPVQPQEVREVPLGQVGVPADATAVVLNVGVTDAFPGFWTAYPFGVARPTNVSTTNIDALGQTRNSQAIVRLEPGPRTVNVFAQSGGHLIVDVVGYFTGDDSAVSADGLFVALDTPIRSLDTRQQYAIAPWGGSTIEFGSGSPFPASTAAAAINVTITAPLNLGFVTAFPAGVSLPLAANVNVDALDQTIANHGTVRLGTRGGALFTQSGAHMIVDVIGWYLGTPEASGPVAANPQPGVTYATRVRSAVLNTPVGYGSNIDSIVGRGLAGLYAGSGRLGVPDRNVLFAHRTEARGPFRYLDQMSVGSTFTVEGANGVTFVYRVMETGIINPIPSVLMAMVARAGTTTVTLVACHPLGSVRQRIVVTGRLIGLA